VRAYGPIAILAALSACGGDAGASDAGDASDAGEGTPVAAACTPSKTRCAAFGKERPARLSEHSGVYDPQRGELIVFGGTSTIPEACALGGPVRYEDATWIYDDACNAWQRVQGAGPSASGRHMAAFGDGSAWVFGGRFRDESSSGDYALYADLYRFDVAARAWSSVAVSGKRPSARVNGALVWDDTRDVLWLFGGNASTSGASYLPLDDVWSFDPQAGRWTEQTPADAGPAPRLFQAALYDRKRDALVIFGGADASAFSGGARYFADLWSLSLSDLRWSALHEGGTDAPEGRFWSGLVHDPERDVYLLFGGHDDRKLGNRNDAWRFDPSARTWTRTETGDLWNTDARGVCDFPPDFTRVDLTLPERRSAHTLVWSAPCGHALLFGGKTDCGAIDDVWRWDGERFEEALPATEGEACLRWRDQPERCMDMCF